MKENPALSVYICFYQISSINTMYLSCESEKLGEGNPR